MKIQSNHFGQEAAINLKDEALAFAVKKATRKAFDGRLQAMAEISTEHGEQIRMQAASAKRRVLENLPALLELAEQRMTENGMQVLWAKDESEACELVLEIAKDHQAGQIVKGKSMLTEEIGLNDALQKAGVSVLETDLGEYILQLNHEYPSHIVTPVLHKTKESIRDLFIKETGMPFTNDAGQIAGHARKLLRNAFLTADMGITGGNFIVAETGTLCLATNEGNGRMVTSLPRIHVALVGIEKIVATMEDFATLTQALSRSATGQKITVYTNMINGPRRPEDQDGPEKVFVIFVDNGRSKIYASKYAEALACIRCGACLNACPVYHQIGGHPYGWVYPGPIGSIITPLMKGLENASPLPYASSLCGACKVACPVDIDIPRMLLELRNDLVETKLSAPMMNFMMKAWMIVMASKLGYSLSGKAAAWFTNLFPIQKILPPPFNGWAKYRQFPQFSNRSFHSMWKEKAKKDG
ncbi:MAG: iron-sulfur cluster-binding protein [Anaerolineaceae bacterium]|nr:iron-sulfur cluster-binding protein [Anaerolineaceae bacterium]